MNKHAVQSDLPVTFSLLLEKMYILIRSPPALNSTRNPTVIVYE